MADETPDPAATTTVTPANVVPNPAPPATGEGDGSKTAVLADLARERDRRQQAEQLVAQLQGQVKQFEDAGKSETEKLTGERDSYKTRADSAETELLRYKACEAEGLPLSAARFLAGGNEDEIKAAATALKALGLSVTPPAGGNNSLPPIPSGAGDANAPKSGGVDAGKAAYEAERATKKTSPFVPAMGT